MAGVNMNESEFAIRFGALNSYPRYGKVRGGIGGAVEVEDEMRARRMPDPPKWCVIEVFNGMMSDHMGTYDRSRPRLTAQEAGPGRVRIFSTMGVRWPPLVATQLLLLRRLYVGVKQDLGTLRQMQHNFDQIVDEALFQHGGMYYDAIEHMWVPR